MYYSSPFNCKKKMESNREPRPAKRPVCRPKIIKPVAQAATHRGIVAEPIISDHAIEMVYDTPINLKKIFTLFKLMDTRDVKMEFRLSGVRISGTGHLKHKLH